ncbi:MAG TPA: hypothetical protein VNF29_08425 [Candidatus Binataceae bacterium]|nr:hypothetical protein [Candidatus Binataceae bacterium]
MKQKFRPRFRSTAAALRFFFRLSALLRGVAFNPQVQLPRIARDAAGPQPGALGDFARIRACVDNLSRVQLFVLAELYGPTCFALGRRSFARACGAAGRGDPGTRVSAKSLGSVRRSTLSALRARLRRRHVVVAAPAHRGGRFSICADTWPSGGRDRGKLER